MATGPRTEAPAGAGPTFSSPSPRGTAAILALYVKVGACALAVGADVRRIVVAGALRDERASVDSLLAADQLVTVAAALELAALVAAAVLFLRWQVVAHRNLAALGRTDPTVGVGAGVAAWFVPVVNLGLPLLVVADLWRAGDGRTARVGRLLGLWWAAWLVALAAAVASWALLGDAADVAERQRIDALRAGGAVLSAVAAGFTIAVLSAVTSRQEARASAVGAPRAPVAGPGETAAARSGLRVLSEEQARRDVRGA